MNNPQLEQLRAILAKLVGAEFPGSDALRAQLRTASTHDASAGGSPALVITVAPDAGRAEVVRRVPIEGVAEDADGHPVHVLVHVVDGLLAELEVFREDGSTIRKQLGPDDVRLLLYS